MACGMRNMEPATERPTGMRGPRATAVPRMLSLLYWLGLKSQEAFAPGAWGGLGSQGLPQQGRK